MARFVKKPTEVDAIQWLGSNFSEVCEFLKIAHGVKGFDVSDSDSDLVVLLKNDNEKVVVGVGEWVVNMEDGITFAVDNDHFHNNFSPV